MDSVFPFLAKTQIMPIIIFSNLQGQILMNLPMAILPEISFIPTTERKKSVENMGAGFLLTTMVRNKFESKTDSGTSVKKLESSQR